MSMATNLTLRSSYTGKIFISLLMQWLCHFSSAYGHKTWQDGDLPCKASIHKTTWLLCHIGF